MFFGICPLRNHKFHEGQFPRALFDAMYTMQNDSLTILTELVVSALEILVELIAAFFSQRAEQNQGMWPYNLSDHR